MMKRVPTHLTVKTERLKFAAYAVDYSSEDSHCTIHLIASDGEHCQLGGQAVFLRKDHPCADRLVRLLLEINGEGVLSFRFAVWTRTSPAGIKQTTLEIQHVW